MKVQMRQIWVPMVDVEISSSSRGDGESARGSDDENDINTQHRSKSYIPKPLDLHPIYPTHSCLYVDRSSSFKAFLTIFANFLSSFSAFLAAAFAS